MTDLAARAEAISGLADLVRSGLPLRSALCEWPSAAPAAVRDEVVRVRRCLQLHGDVGQAVRSAGFLGGDADALVAICSANDDDGLLSASTLERLAASVGRRARERGSAGAATAGARLQARIVGCLPLLALLIAPAAHVPLFDPIGLVVIALGGGLVTAGMTWMARLVPDPPASDDAVALSADLIAAACEGGASLPAAVSIAMKCAPGDLQVAGRRVRRLIELGCEPGHALAASNVESLQGLRDLLDRSLSLGTPVANALHDFAAARRSDSQVEFEAALRKAPVRMIMPLTLCVLPAFCLLAVTPFMRGLAIG